MCPGGVMECLYMERGREVVYLRKRSGFVRLALQAGAPLVPVFAFGQSDFYGYCRVFHDWPQHVVGWEGCGSRQGGGSALWWRGRAVYLSGSAQPDIVPQIDGGLPFCLQIPRSRWASFVRRIGCERPSVLCVLPLRTCAQHRPPHLPHIHTHPSTRPCAAADVPMLIWGLRGSFMPRRVPLYIAVGKPLAVPCLADPTPAQVQHHLSLFIADMERLFMAHRAAAGYPTTTLTIY